MELSDAITQLESHIECPVCYEVLTAPKLLTCGHRFCQPCLVRVENGYSIKCPLCQSVTKKRANQLPSDRLAADIKEELDNIRDAIHKKYCVACPGTKASSRCFTCQSSLCKKCCKTHFEIYDNMNHIVVEYGLSLSCDQHGKDLGYVCENCDKTVCSSCLIQGCYSHKYSTIWSAVEEFLEMKKRTRMDPQLIQKHFPDYKQNLLHVFDSTVVEIQNHSDRMIQQIQRKTRALIDSVNELKSEAMKILEATKTAADLLQDFRETDLSKCRYEIPLNLFRNLSDILKPEVQDRKARCAIMNVGFKANEDISVGTLHVTLSQETPLYPVVPQLYRNHVLNINARDTMLPKPTDDVNTMTCLLDTDKGGGDKTIEELFSENGPQHSILRTIFRTLTGYSW